MRTSRKEVFLIAAFAVFAYAVVSSLAYRFQAPDKSETRLFLELPRAFLWKAPL